MTALVYTPILIKFLSPILNIDGEPLNKSENVRLTITTPASNARGVNQALRRKYSIVLPNSGLLRLKLLASNNYLPMGRYEVKYFLGGSDIASTTQYWVVPSPPATRTITIAHADNTGTYVFKEDDQVFDIVRTSIVGGAFAYDYPQIVWSTGSPVEGQSYSITYQPAVTLDQLLATDLTNTPHSHAGSY